MRLWPIPGVCVFLLVWSTAFAEQLEPLAPEESLARIQVAPGLRVELVVAEPLVVDPVALAFDPLGRMYVVENTGYPEGPPEGEPPAGKVVLLTDSSGDGEFDTRTVFADGLDFPNGVMPWRDGVLVTDAPHVWYMRDTTGDGRADIRESLLEGFALGGSTQLRVSHPTLGLDNWIYFTNGLSGGEIVIPGQPEAEAVRMGGNDLRYHPLSKALETTAGQAQFGQSFDDLGNKYTCHNRKHVELVVVQPEDLARNPYLGLTQSIASIPEHGAAAQIFAISEARTTAYAHAGTFTAACGLLIYRGTALPEGHYGNSFICEPTGNLVHRDLLLRDGSTKLARRAYEEAEFFASSDEWSRPVFLANAPDGALYIADMYRMSIEHPVYMAPEVVAVTDLYAGDTLGRIYRVVADDAPPTAELKQRGIFSSQDTAALVARLDDENAWTRETAHRLLLERLDPDAVPLLDTVLQENPSTQARLHALHLLNAHDALSTVQLEHALKPESLPSVSSVSSADTGAPLREHALRLVRQHELELPGTEETIASLADDPDPRVRFVTALALGDDSSEENARLLARIAVNDIEDAWTRTAVLSSAGASPGAFVEAFLAQVPLEAEGLPPFMLEVGRLMGAALPPEQALPLLEQVLEKDTAHWQLAAMAGVLAGVQRNDAYPDTGTALDRLLETGSPELGEQVAALVAHCERVARDEEAGLVAREHAVRVLGHAGFEAGGETLISLLTPRTIQDVQLAAIEALAQTQDERVAEALTAREHWRGFTTGVRGRALSALLQQPARTRQLLDAVESGDVPAWSVDPGSRSRLQNSSDEGIKERARALFAGVQRPSRSAVYEEYRSVLDYIPNPANGREVFLNNCATCHTFGDKGHLVGPDLTGIRSQPVESILLHIIDPNWLMEPGYENYVVETSDFETYSGLITAQTSTSITLRQPQGIETTIARDNIDRIEATSLSMMPEELEQAMTRQEIRDLIGFLKGE